MPRYPELTTVIDKTILRFYKQNGETSRQEVGKAVISENKELIRELGITLAETAVYELVGARLHRTTEVNKHDYEQFSLPFEIENIPPAICFRDKDSEEIRFKPIWRATEEHLIAYEGILRAQIAADSKRLLSIQTLHEGLRPIFEANPGITVAQACAIYRGEAA